jgi:hypothetical protein
MPRRKQWAPLAHGFNRDPQVRELRKTYSDWMALVWLELVSIADMNDGEVKGTVEHIAESLAYISMTNRPRFASNRITNALRFMSNCGWIQIQTDRVLVVNYVKYHPLRYDKKGFYVDSTKLNETKLNETKEEEEDNTSHLGSNGALPKLTPEGLIALYNETVNDNFSAVEKISEGRLKKSRQYLKQFPGREFWLEVFKELNSSAFLAGKNNNPGHESFRANFDWLLSKGKDGTENVVKVYEGKYRE